MREDLSRIGPDAWAVAVFLFHWGVFATMGIRFRYQLCGVAFIAFLLPLRSAIETTTRTLAVADRDLSTVKE